MRNRMKDNGKNKIKVQEKIESTNPPTLGQLVKIRHRKAVLRNLTRKKLDVVSGTFLFGVSFLMFHLISPLQAEIEKMAVLANLPDSNDRNTIIGEISYIEALQHGRDSSLPALSTLETDELWQLLMNHTNTTSYMDDTLKEYMGNYSQLTIILNYLISQVISLGAVKFGISKYFDSLENSDDNKQNENINFDMAEEIIFDLEKKIKILKNKPWQYLTSYLAALSMAAMVGLKVMESQIDSNYRVLLLGYALISQILGFGVGSMSLIENYFDNQSLENVLKSYQDDFVKILPEEFFSERKVKIYKGSDIDSSYLGFTFSDYYEKFYNYSEHINNYENKIKMSGYLLSRIVTHILLKNNVEIIAHQDNKLVVALCDIDPEKIKKEIENAVNRRLEIKKFTIQVKAVLEERLGMHGHERLFCDKNGNENIIFSYDRIANFSAEDHQKLNEFCRAAGATIEVNDNIISISGFKSCDYKAFIKIYPKKQADVYTIPKTQKQDLNTVDNAEINANEDKEEITPVRHRSTRKEKKEIEPSTTIPASTSSLGSRASTSTLFASTKKEESSISIEWHAKDGTYIGKYESTDDECPIRAITGTGIPENTFFLRFDLTKEFLSAYPNAYETFAAIAKDAHLAPGRRKAQGFVFCNEGAKDMDGKSFIAEAKLKALGIFGNHRAYAPRPIKAATGESLYIIKGYNPKAH